MRYLISILASTGLMAAAPILPSGYSSTTITSSLNGAVALALAPDGRIFVTEQTGNLRIIENNVLLSNNLLTLGVDSGGERGLLGVALSPNFSSDGFVYVYHTVPASGGNPAFNRVSRFTATGNTASGQSTIATLSNLGNPTNHNGGAIHFGPDGKLYVSTGDAAFNAANSQNLSNTHGKILRYNQDGSIPTDNPFFNTVGANQAIYQYGLRNPFTFAFNPANGALYVNDVGAGTWEEINSGAAGANFGWPNSEGATNNPAFTTPLYSYSHGGGAFQGFAIAGGVFQGNRYYYGDFINSWVNYLDINTMQVSAFGTGFGNVVDMAEAADGQGFYVLTRNSLILVTADAPEPGTWMVAVGLAMIGLRKKLRRKS